MAEAADGRSWRRNAYTAAGTDWRSVNVALPSSAEGQPAQDVHLDFQWHSSWVLKNWQQFRTASSLALRCCASLCVGIGHCDPTWVFTYAHKQRLTLLTLRTRSKQTGWKVQKNADPKHDMQIFGVIPSSLSSYKTTLKQKLNGEKRSEKWDGELSHFKSVLGWAMLFSCPVDWLDHGNNMANQKTTTTKTTTKQKQQQISGLALHLISFLFKFTVNQLV